MRRLLKDMPIGMLTTQTSDGVTHSRPMVVDEIDECGWLWFLTDRASRKTLELIQNPQTTIAFQSPTGDRYVSVQGTAVIVQDAAKVKRMWKPALRAWFPRGRGETEVVTRRRARCACRVLAGAAEARSCCECGEVRDEGQTAGRRPSWHPRSVPGARVTADKS